MYAKFEEEHGLIRHAMRVFDRAVNAVAKSDRKEIFDIYVVKVAESYGVTATREIYEKAIQLLPNKDAKEICLSYANLERKLGEIDRARSLYSYASQFSNPKTTPSFWQTWHEFEVAHGNENTYREMLRIKRSVQASYDSKVILVHLIILIVLNVFARLRYPLKTPRLLISCKQWMDLCKCHHNY